MKTQKSKQDYRLIVKALKYKVITLDQQIKKQKAKNQQLNRLASPIQLKTTNDLRRLRDKLSHNLGALGMTFTDYFKLFDHDFIKIINKQEKGMIPDFKNLLQLITVNKGVNYDQFRLAIQKIGIFQGIEKADYSYIFVARYIYGKGIKQFWQSLAIQQDKQAIQYISNYLVKQFSLFDVLNFEEKLLQGDDYMDFQLFQYRIFSMLSQQSNSQLPSQYQNCFLPINQKESKQLAIFSNDNFAPPKNDDIQIKFLDTCLGQIKNTHTFDSRRIRHTQDINLLIQYLKKHKTSLSQILNLILSNIPQDNKLGVITDHTFMKCIRAGGLRGVPPQRQSKVFQLIDRQQKGYISFQDILFFLLVNRQENDKIDTAIWLLLQSSNQIEGNNVQMALNQIEHYQQMQLLDVDDLISILGINPQPEFTQTLQLLMIWLMQIDRKKLKSQKLPQKIGCSQAYLKKRLKKRLQDKQYQQSDDQQTKILRSKMRMTTNLQIMDVQNQLSKAMSTKQV